MALALLRSVGLAMVEETLSPENKSARVGGQRRRRKAACAYVVRRDSFLPALDGRFCALTDAVVEGPPKPPHPKTERKLL